MVFSLVIREVFYFLTKKFSLIGLGFSSLVIMFGSFTTLQEKPSRELPGGTPVPRSSHPSWPVTKPVQEVSKPFGGGFVWTRACQA